MDILNFLFWLVHLALSLLRRCGKGLLWLAGQLFKRRPTTFGSAGWAGFWQLLFSGALGRKGIIVGKKFGRFLRYSGEGAVMAVAPMGSGKGAGLVIPALLDYPGAVICTDPKGENEYTTGEFRQTLGPVYRLDAITPARSDCYNPLDIIRRNSETEFDDALILADLLVVPEGSDAHWDTSAKNTLAACIMYVMRTRPEPEHTLAAVARLIDDEGETLRETFAAMAGWPEQSIASIGKTALRGLDNDEFLSVMSNTSKALKIWASDRIAGRLSMKSNFDLMDVHSTTMTLYVMVPEELLQVYGPYMRVIMGCVMAVLVRGKQRKRAAVKPLLLIDECQALGRLEALERGVGYLRSYARLMLITQDWGRMRALYGEHGLDSFIAASGAQVLFGVNDLRTARDLAEILGPRTVHTRSHGQSQANTDMVRRQDQAGTAEAARHLLDASEIMRLKARQAIVRMNTLRYPVRAGKVRFFKERRWAGLWRNWLDRDDAPELVSFESADPSPAPGVENGGRVGAGSPEFPANPPIRRQSGQSPHPPASAVS